MSKLNPSKSLKMSYLEFVHISDTTKKGALKGWRDNFFLENDLKLIFLLLKNDCQVLVYQNMCIEMQRRTCYQRMSLYFRFGGRISDILFLSFLILSPWPLSVACLSNLSRAGVSIGLERSTPDFCACSSVIVFAEA